MHKVSGLVAWTVASFIAAAQGRAQTPAPQTPGAAIQPQLLAGALQEWATQTGWQLMYDSMLAADQRSNGSPQGLYPIEGLARILEGTGLDYRFLNDRTVAILPATPTRALPVALRMQASDRNNERALRVADAQAAPSSENVTTTNQLADITEVLVTAQKRSQRLIDVPISIAALNSETLDRAGVDNLLDLSHAVPGIVVADTGGGFMRYYVRGIGNVYGTASTALVGVYLDEGDVTGSSTTQLDLRTQDIERVEVLKGPQGTLYGAGASGGVVRFITRDPQLDRFTASGDIDFFGTRGGSSSQTVSAVLNVPVVENVFGLRIVGNYSDLGGWVDQPAAGRSDINNQDLREVRVKGLWKPIDNLAVKATAYVHRNEGDGLPSSTNDDYDLVAAVDPTRQLPFSTDFNIFNLTGSYDFPALTVLSSSSYVDNEAAYSISQKYATAPAPAPLFEALVRDDPLNTESFSQEFRLGSREGGRFNWTTGLFYKHMKFDRGRRLELAQGATRLGTVNVLSQEDSKSRSLFGDASYAVTKRVEIGAGIRYFKEDLESFNGTLLRKGDFSSVDPRVYFSYGFTPDMRLYVSAADGFRSGGFNVVDGSLSTFDPEKVRSYEIGLKSALLERRLTADVAFFFSNYKDMQLFKLGTNNLGAINNSADGRVMGVDVALDWQVTDKLMFQLSGNYTDAEIDSVLPGTVTVVKGDPVDYSVDYAATFAGTYSFNWAAALPGFIRIDYNRLGPSHVTDRSIPVPVLYQSDENTLLNARLGMEWKRWSFELYGENLTDENRLQDPLGSFGLGARPRPRTVGVQLGVQFD